MGNRIYLSYADHLKKRFRAVVTEKKAEEDIIVLSNVNYDIPEALIDKKFT